jgi:hypothetical protein
MIHDIRIHDICRTERYYTATLLPYALLHDSFAGVRAFLHILEDKGICALGVRGKEPSSLNGSPFTHIELISEMDIVRDAQFYSPWLPGLDDVSGEEAESLCPDLVVVADGLLLVIEAKFFHTSISTDKIRTQILAQRKVIEDILLRFPGYSFDRYCHLFLSAAPVASAVEIGCQGVLLWEDVTQLAEQVLGREHYVTQRLRRAVAMYELVQGGRVRSAGKSGRNYRGRLGLDEIIRKCQDDGDRLLVGYYGGERRLTAATLEDLTNRLFKWDWADDPVPNGRKVPSNWMVGSKFLRLVTAKSNDLCGTAST